MGNYISQSDIEGRFPSDSTELALITTDDTGATTPDAAVIAEAIDDAEGIIDSYVGLKYVVPMTSVPLAIVRAAVSLAIYFLYENKSTARADENIRKNYEDALQYLKDVSAGKAVIVGATGVEQTLAQDPSTVSYFSAEDRVFSRTKLETF